MSILKRLTILLPIVTLSFMGCGLIEWEEKPTKAKMEGIWKVTEAHNSKGESILEKISFPVVGFQMQGENHYLSTAEPMFSYIVYGNSKYASKYAEVASKFDQALDYSKLEVFKGCEWAIGTGVVDRFTMEMTISGFPGVGTITEFLSWLGIYPKIPILTVYHKFMDIKVTFNSFSDSTMVWEFDDKTTAEYNCKDEKLKYYLWDGVEATNFARCKFVLTKQVKTLKEVVTGK